MLRRLKSAWTRHTPGGFVRLVGKNAAYYAKRLVTGRLFRKPTPTASEFDRAFGADTEGIREIGSLDVQSASARHAVRYQPSPHQLATSLIGALPIEWRRFTFLDFGAGKGRVLMIAARYPFAAVAGVEFSAELCEIAAANIARLPETQRRAARVECHHSDATTFDLPREPLVCYFYNPFGQAVMQAVEKRLAESLAAEPRDIYIIYVHPEHRNVFDHATRWEVVDDGGFHVVYRARAGAPGQDAP